MNRRDHRKETLMTAMISKIQCAAFRSIGLVGLGLAFPACTQVEKIQSSGGGGASVPEGVQTVFNDRCNIGGCHDATSKAGGLVLTAPASNDIIGGRAQQSPLPLVDLGNISGSYLAIKLLPQPPAGVERQGDRMPLAGELQSVDNAIILGWIAGAELPGGVAEGGDDGSGDDDDGIVECSIFTVAPGAPSPVQAGMLEGLLPPEIGAALDNNCGCHFSSSLIAGALPYTGAARFTTHAEFQATYAGTTPLYAGLPTWEVVLDRIADQAAPMPPAYYCVLEDGAPISAADRDLLLSWLMAGAPDAPTWAMPPE